MRAYTASNGKSIAAKKPKNPTDTHIVEIDSERRTYPTAVSSARPSDSRPGRRLAAAAFFTAGYRPTTKTTARKLSALRKNATAGPAAASTRPPMAGPPARARLKPTEFIITASAVCERGTSSGTSDCHDGPVSALPMPSAALEESRSHGVVQWRYVAIASINATASIQLCPTRSSTRRSKRSASTPAGTSRPNIGNVTAVASAATGSGSFVNDIIVQLSATSWIQVPKLENTAASHSARNAGTESG